MVSRWSDKKPSAIALRESGMSIRTIEKQLGIPRSTLSNWFRDVRLSPVQQTRLEQSRKDNLLRARILASEWHRAQKTLRLVSAKNEAQQTLAKLKLSPEVLDLAFAMLYMGEGRKANSTAIGSSDPVILRFVLAVLKLNYTLPASKIKCELHLRMDQDDHSLRKYWSEELSVPIENFTTTAFDKRSLGKASYPHYKGVCVLQCGNIAIQRKLVYLYTLFCKKVAELEAGG